MTSTISSGSSSGPSDDLPTASAPLRSNVSDDDTPPSSSENDSPAVESPSVDSSADESTDAKLPEPPSPPPSAPTDAAEPAEPTASPSPAEIAASGDPFVAASVSKTLVADPQPADAQPITDTQTASQDPVDASVGQYPTEGWSPEEPSDAQQDAEAPSSTEEPLAEGEPVELPAPLGRSYMPPVGAVAAGFLSATVMGFAWALLDPVLYLPIVRAILAGLLVGWTAAWIPRRGSLGGTTLAVISGCLAVWVLAVWIGGGFLWTLHRDQALEWWSTLGPDAQLDGFTRHLDDLALRTVLGYSLGPYGQYVIWSAELTILFMCIGSMVRTAHWLRSVNSVPVDVLEYVVELSDSGYSTAEIRQALTDHGWPKHRDQIDALTAGRAYRRLVGTPRKKR